jgi:hypothetical protein
MMENESLQEVTTDKAADESNAKWYGYKFRPAIAVPRTSIPKPRGIKPLPNQLALFDKGQEYAG